MRDTIAPGPCPSRTQLIRFLGDELEDLAIEALTTHVEVCESCQRELDHLSEDFSIARRFPSIPEFHIEGEIGRGGMGTVYVAHRAGTEDVVAIKVMPDGYVGDTERQRRFQLEIDALQRLEHPGIVRILGSGFIVEQPYYVMEYISGLTLGQFTRGAPQIPQQALRIMKPIAEAIAYAHSRRIIHRDLKPSNILLSPIQDGGITLLEKTESRRYDVKILDFSVAKLLDSGQTMTRTGEVLGTLDYMSPEQVLGGEVGPASDIYSCGVVLYELLTGRTPHRAASLPELIEQVRNVEPVSLRALIPTIPKDVESVCLKCLEKEPLRRYASAEALASDLARAIAGVPVQARPISSIRKLGRWIQRRPATAVVLLSAIVFIAAGLLGSQLLLWQARIANQRILEAQSARQQAELFEQTTRSELLNSIQNDSFDESRFQLLQSLRERAEEQVLADPSDGKARRDLMFAYRTLCWMSWPKPSIEEVDPWFKAALLQLDELERLGEDSSFIALQRRDLYNMWGNVYRVNERYASAIQKYRLSIQTMEQAGNWQQDLASRHYLNTVENNLLLRSAIPLYRENPTGQLEVQRLGWESEVQLLREAEKNVEDSYRIVCENRYALNSMELSWLSDDFEYLTDSYLMLGDLARARVLFQRWGDIADGWQFGDAPRLDGLWDLVNRTRSDEDARLLAQHLSWLRQARRVQDPDIQSILRTTDFGRISDLPIIAAVLAEVEDIGPRPFPTQAKEKR
jgi:serine/threonine protein kinase